MTETDQPPEAFELPTEIVLSGGGTNTLAIVGALHALQEKRQIDEVVRWVGSSAGALVCLFSVLGYSAEALFRLLLHIDYAKLNEVSCDNVLSFYDTMGVIDGTHIMRVLELAVTKKGYSKDVTFKDLYENTKCGFVVTGYNLTRGKTEAFDSSRTPDMSVLLACRISISVPFLFRPVVHHGEMYVDGCTIEHVPVKFSTHGERALIIECVGHSCSSGPHVSALPQDIPSFFALFNRRIGMVLYKKCMHRSHKTPSCNILSLQMPEKKNGSFVVDFGLSKEQKHKLFDIGYTSAQNQLSSNVLS